MESKNLKSSKKRLEYMKEYNKKNKERISIYQKAYYLEHNDEVIKQSLRWSKNNKYKRAKHKRDWRIKNKDYDRVIHKTKHYFPITKDTKCAFCRRNAIEHHHNTIPIKFDKFDYVCRTCHFRIHNKTKHIEMLG